MARLAPIRRQIARSHQSQNNNPIHPSFHNKWGTWSDIIGWIINVIVAGCTIALFILTRDTLNLSRTTLDEAKRANDISNKNNIEAKRANDISQNNYNLAQRQFEAYTSQRFTDSITNADEIKKRDYLDYIKSAHEDSIFSVQLQINKSTLNAFEKIALYDEQQFIAEGPKLELDKINLLKSKWGYRLQVYFKNRGHRDLTIIEGNMTAFNEVLDTLETASLSKYIELSPGYTQAINTAPSFADTIIRAPGSVIVVSCSYADSEFGKGTYEFIEVIGNITFNQSTGVLQSYSQFTPEGKEKIMDKINKKLDSMLKD